MNGDEQPKPPTDAERFASMADRIRHNAGAPFGGAFVVVPPNGGGPPMEALLIDSGNPAQFLALLKARIDHELSLLKDQERMGMGGMRR
jgi:hypothetical protein